MSDHDICLTFLIYPNYFKWILNETLIQVHCQKCSKKYYNYDYEL